MRHALESLNVNDFTLTLFKSNEVVYKFNPARLGCKTTYSVVTYNQANEPIDMTSFFSIPTKAEAKKLFKQTKGFLKAMTGELT